MGGTDQKLSKRAKYVPQCNRFLDEKLAEVICLLLDPANPPLKVVCLYGGAGQVQLRGRESA